MQKRFVFAISALLALPLGAQVPQAVALMNQARYDEAKKLLAPMTTDAAALDALGRIAMAQDDADRAAELLQKAVALRPNVALYHYHLGEAYGNQALKAGLFGKASLAGKVRDEFAKAAELDPNFIDARLGLIDFYTMAPSMMGGSETKALAEAAEIKKRDAFQGHRAYARVYVREKKPDLARKEYQDFVREQPQSARAHYLFGAFVTANDKNYKLGFEELETAIRLDPAFMLSWFRLGTTAALSGAQLPRGEEALRKYLAYQPKENEPSLGDANYYLGLIYEKQGKKAEAKQAFAAALRYAPASKTISEALKRVS